MPFIRKTPARFSSRPTFSLVFLLQPIYLWKACGPSQPLPSSATDGLVSLTPSLDICTGSLCPSLVTCPCFHLLKANSSLPYRFFTMVHGRRMKGNGYELKQDRFSLDKAKPSPHPVHTLSGNMFLSLSRSPVALLHADQETQQLAEMYKHFLDHALSLDQQWKLIPRRTSVLEQAC